VDPAVKQLHDERRSNVPAMLFSLLAVALGVISLASGRPTAHPAWIVAVTLALAYFQYCWTSIFHEDVHLALYRARWHNVFNGTIVGTLLMVPFSLYRQVHIRHHNRMNTPDDWELWPYTDPAASLTFRRVFAVLDVLFGAWVGPYIYGRMFWVPGSPLRDPVVRRRIGWEYVLIIVFWGTLLAAVAMNGWWREFSLAYVLPAWVTGMLQTLRKFVDHLGLPAGEALHGCRTIVSGSVPGRLVDWTSFDISVHGLHHRYPQMPHGNLARAAELARDNPGAPIFTSHLQAFRHMLPHLLFPGIGVNARPRPALGPSSQVEVPS
jgi:fatty acid desaturase